MKKFALLVFLIFGSFIANSQEFEDLKEIIDARKNSTEISKYDYENEEVIFNEQSENTLKIVEEFEKPDSESVEIFGASFINNQPVVLNKLSDLPIPSEYRISLRDELSIILTGTQKRQFEAFVQLDGSILFPELGSIYIVGDTIFEAKEKIKNLVEKSYVGVEVDISVTNLSAKKINIIGAVKLPGTYIVNPFTTITSALTYAGGIEEYASLRSILLKRANGEEVTFDLYDLLIFGNRGKDTIVNSGDTLIIQATNNFVNISGAVIRPMIYEYMEDDSYSDLISFALGPNSIANMERVFGDMLDNGIYITKKIVLNDLIKNETIDKVVVSSSPKTSLKNISVYGSEVSSGYYDIKDNLTLASLLEKLNFTENIYPYFGLIELHYKEGLKKNYEFFSLLDSTNHSSINLTNNSKVIFFSREEMMNYSSGQEINPFFFDYLRLVPESNIVNINSGGNSYRIPISGSFSSLSILEYWGLINDDSTIAVNLQKNTFELNLEDAADTFFDATEVTTVLTTQKNVNDIEVEILGAIRNPGIYKISQETSLNDLYLLAGGHLERANKDSPLIEREFIKNQQRIALQNSRTVLQKGLLQKLLVANQSQGNTEIESILALSQNVEPSGRLSGSYPPSSESAKNLILNDGDKIYVPLIKNSVFVHGEVLSSTVTSAESNMPLQYYIDVAGGFSKYADKNSIYIIKSNGVSVPYKRRAFSRDILIEPGDTIVVPRDLSYLDGLPLITTATKIISDIAFSAASLNVLRN